MESALNSSAVPMVSVCQTCGDYGFPNALIICEKCRIYTQHRYCAKELTFTEDVVWYCEDCEPFANHAEPSKEPPRRRKRLKENWKCKSSARPTKPQKVDTHSGAVNGLQNCNSPLPTCEKHVDGPRENQAKAEEHGTVTVKKLMQDGKCNSVEKAMLTEGEVSKIVTDDPCESMDDCSHIPAQPIIDSAWKGEFDINLTASNKKFGLVKGVTAHLSSKACLKVHQEACLLPASLSLDMLCKVKLWPKSFADSPPIDGNVALYFFPANPGDEKLYDELVNAMVCEELAMKAMVKNAELLIFPSSELPLRYWRFQGKQYLWGVFRGKKASS